MLFFAVSSTYTVELSRFDLVSVWIFFIIEKILSHSELELGIVITALTILDISGDLGVLVIFFFITSTSPQMASVLVPLVKLGRSMAGVSSGSGTPPLADPTGPGALRKKLFLPGL